MSGQFSLHEFQPNAHDRLQGETADGHISTLGIQAGEDYWLVDMGDISEVLPLPPLTPVPFTRPWYCGVANVRGSLYSITDLAAFLEQGATPREGSSRVLLVNPKFTFNAGLLVTRVLGLRDASNWQRDDTVAYERYRDEQGQVWRKLDMRRLLQQPEFLHIGIQDVLQEGMHGL